MQAKINLLGFLVIIFCTLYEHNEVNIAVLALAAADSVIA